MRRAHLTVAVFGGVVAFSAAGGVWLAAQQPAGGQTQARFRTDTDVVRLEVTVLDRERRAARGLTAADFTVLEDGRARAITTFASVELPSVPADAPAASWMREAPRDVVTNAGAVEGRLVVIVFDWSIRGLDQERARRIGKAAVDALGPADQAAVTFTSAFAAAGASQNFTADRALLNAAIDRPFAVAVVDPLVGNGVGLADAEGFESGDCLCRACSVEALTRVANTLRDVSQRPKVVLFITTYPRAFEEMAPEPIKPLVPGRMWQQFSSRRGVCSARLRDTRRELERAMGEANATVHVIDPVGLDTSESTPLGSGTRIRERLETLPVVADLTGGRTVMQTQTPEAVIPAILDETSSYYLLGFAPASTALDGRSHRLEVRVRRPGVTVKARQSYARTKEPPSTAMPEEIAANRTLAGVLPTRDLVMEASVVPMLTVGETKTAAIVVTRLTATAPAMTMMTAVFTPKGAPVVSKRRNVETGMPAALGASPHTLVSGVPLEPGRYELRVMTELPSGLAGSVYAFIDVPDFKRDALAMSGVLVKVEPGEPAAPRDEIDGMLPFAPTARRAFDRTERVSAFVQISQGLSRTDAVQPVTLRARVLDSQDREVRHEALVLQPAEFSSNRTASPRLTLPMPSLAAGQYLWVVEAEMGDRRVARSVRFEVR